MHTSDAGLLMIEEFEGGRSADGLFHAYWDALGHVWTIGFGETEGVRQGMAWTLDRALADLRDRLAREYEPAIDALGVELTQEQFDGLASFVWNTGPGSIGPGTTVGRLLRERDFHGAADAMLQWDHAGGEVVPGLLRRREAEAAKVRSTGGAPGGTIAPVKHPKPPEETTMIQTYHTKDGRVGIAAETADGEVFHIEQQHPPGEGNSDFWRREDGSADWLPLGHPQGRPAA